MKHSFCWNPNWWHVAVAIVGLIVCLIAFGWHGAMCYFIGSFIGGFEVEVTRFTGLRVVK